MKKLILLSVFLCFASTTFAQDATEVAFVKSVLNKAQSLSIKAGREYCGYIGIAPNGTLKATKPKRGRLDSCRPREPSENIELIASYHTHASFDIDADSEVPSSNDVLADMDEELDGYVATPGGRLWFIDGQRGVAKQICGRKCLLSDKAFQADIFEPIKKRYTVEQLERREQDL